jgi:hypothetical protein
MPMFNISKKKNAQHSHLFKKNKESKADRNKYAVKTFLK